MKVVDLMTTRVATVRPETPLKEVARVLAEHRVSGVPVVDAEQRVLGVVSEADFLEREAEGSLPRTSWLARMISSDDHSAMRARLAATTAGAAMSTPAVTVGPGATIKEAAALMSARAINRLPVVEDGRLLGIVTRADILDAYLQSDGELRRTVQEEILRDTMWLDPDELEVSVLEGIVFLMGRVDRRSTADILERLIRQLDGVLGVRCELTWDLDDRHIQPVGELHREPGAASLRARVEPRPTH